MTKYILIAVESVSLIVAVIFCVLWVIYPGGSYEPTIVLCSILGFVLEFTRRVKNREERQGQSRRLEANIDLTEDLRQRVDDEKLSLLFPKMIRLAQVFDDDKAEKWARCELNGYFEDMAENDEVPEYRMVVGQHCDEMGRPLIIADPDLSFVNTTRLRNGVAELEQMASRDNTIFIRETDVIQHIKENLGVQVTRFGFSPIHVTAILTAIRIRLSEWVYKMSSQRSAEES